MAEQKQLLSEICSHCCLLVGAIQLALDSHAQEGFLNDYCIKELQTVLDRKPSDSYKLLQEQMKKQNAKLTGVTHSR